MTFCETTRDKLFERYDKRLFSVDEHIVCFKENKAKRPEFDYDRFELADRDNSECKAHFILKNMICRR